MVTLNLGNAVKVADVSGWQLPDLSPLAGDGFAAVIIKVAERLHVSNNVQRQQAVSALRAGLVLLGKYEFSVGGDDGAAECDTALAQLVDLPFLRVVMDAEASTMGPLPDAGQAVAFGRRAREWNPNVRPILYASQSVIAPAYGGTPEIAELFDAWPAQYDSYAPRTWPAHNPNPPPPPFREIIGWQFTSTYPSSIGAIDASVFDPSVLGAPAPPEPERKRAPMAVVGHHFPDGAAPGGGDDWYAIDGGVLLHVFGGDRSYLGIPHEAVDAIQAGMPIVPLSDGDLAALKRRSGWA